MVLEIISADSLIMNGVEQELFSSQTELAHYSIKVFLDELVSGDEVLLRVYDKDEEAGVEKKYRTTEIQGFQVNPETLINWIPSSSYRVTIQQITGPNKTITWALYKS